MLFTATILVGGGIVETTNLGQMVESLRFPAIVTPTSLSLFSVAQSGGRVATGALSDWALTANTNRCFVDRGVPRPFFLVVGSIIAVVAHTLLAISTEEWSFVLGIALSGLAFGSVWPLMVLIVGEIYGTAHVGANYMFYDGFTSAAGAFLLSKVVAQQVYDSHIHPHYSDADDGATCYGQECFQVTHVIIAFLSLICVATSLLFQYSTRDRYN
jgi:MFS family permease